MRHFLFLLVLLVCLGKLSWAQTQASWVLINGQVTQAGIGTPLASVSIVARPSRSGTTSLANGTFKLKAQPGDTITFSSLGFENATYFVQKTPVQASIKIALAEKSTQLQEVEVSNRPSPEKIARALRNKKRPPEPQPVKAAPPGKPLFEEKPTVAVKASAYNNPATFLYDKFSQEGKEKQKMAEILEALAAKEKARQDSIKQRKEEEYDKLFLDRNEYFKNPYYRRW